MTDKFMGVRSAVIAALKNEFPRLRSVQPHGGPLDLKELERFTLRVPTARVAWVGTTISRDKTQRATGSSTFAIYVICKDRPRKPAPDQVMRWSEQISVFLDGNRFGLDYISSARVHSTENKYKSDQDITGAAIAEIRFECPMILEAGESEDDIPFPDDQRDITILKSTMNTPTLGGFGFKDNLEVVHTATATVKTVGGLSELAQVALSGVNATHEITIPYASLNLDIQHVVKIGSRLFNINSIENENEANRVLILRCVYRGFDNKQAN